MNRLIGLLVLIAGIALITGCDCSCSSSKEEVKNEEEKAIAGFVNAENQSANQEEKSAEVTAKQEETANHALTIYYTYEGMDPTSGIKPLELQTVGGENALLTGVKLGGFIKTIVAPFDPKKVFGEFMLVEFPPPPLEKPPEVQVEAPLPPSPPEKAEPKAEAKAEDKSLPKVRHKTEAEPKAEANALPKVRPKAKAEAEPKVAEAEPKAAVAPVAPTVDPIIPNKKEKRKFTFSITVAGLRPIRFDGVLMPCGDIDDFYYKAFTKLKKLLEQLEKISKRKK